MAVSTRAASQPDLFAQAEARAAAPTAPASLNIDAQLRAWLALAIKKCPLSRAQIAAGMTDSIFGESAGEDGEVTAHMLNAWTAPSRSQWRFPLEYLPAFVRVTGATWLLDRIAATCGCSVLVGEDQRLAEIGRAVVTKRAAEREIAELQRALGPDGIARLARRGRA